MRKKILIPIANPDTIEDLINLSLVIRDPKQRDNLLALNVINDDSSSESAELRGKRNLEKAAMITACGRCAVDGESRVTT